MGGTGLEQLVNSPKKTQNGNRRAAKSAAIPKDLVKVVFAWAKLPAPVKRAITAMIDATKQ
jgi:hypothetical protein